MQRYKYVALGSLMGTGYLLYGIFTSTNSTAAIGFLFIPVFALCGAFVGFTIDHFIKVFSRKKKFLSWTTLAILLVTSFAGTKQYKSKQRENKIELARNQTTSLQTLDELATDKDPAILQALAGNPSTPKEQIDVLIKEHRYDYIVLSGVAINPKLTIEQISELMSPMEKDFIGKTEYHLYQTFVWAALARRKDLPERIYHELAGKPEPQHFLILALLESQNLNCDEIKKFLPQKNQVLENTVMRSLRGMNCP